MQHKQFKFSQVWRLLRSERASAPLPSAAAVRAAAAAGAGAKLRAARRILAFERFYRRFLPLLLLVLLFASLCWLNIFTLLPGFLHGLLLVIFAAAFMAACLFLCLLPLPGKAEALARLEHDSGLEHDELRLAAEPLAADAPPAAQALWREHKKRMAQAMPKLKLRLPRPNIPAYDRYNLRAAVFLLFAVAFCFQLGGAGGRLSDAFYFGPRFNAADLRINAWINPPDYTGRPPVYPVLAAAAPGADSAAVYSVPAGSRLTVRANDHGRGVIHLACAGADGAAKPAKNADAAATIYNLRIGESLQCRLSAPTFSRIWSIKAEPDLLPQIAWTQPPQRAMNGLLALNYRINDDYGIKRAWAEIVPLDNAATNQPLLPTPYFARLSGAPQLIKRPGGSLTQWQGAALPLGNGDPAAADNAPAAAPLIAPPKLDLRLPHFGPAGADGRRGGEAKTEADFAASPWGGAYVMLRLAAEDAAGQVSYSAPVKLVLPQKTYVNPIARALIEQRRLLAANANAAPRTEQMLNALLAAPDKTIPDKGAALALFSLRARYNLLPPQMDMDSAAAAASAAGYDLSPARLAQALQAETGLRREGLRDIAVYMGAIADGIDGAGLAAAEQKLKQAAQTLRNALRNGADASEIARLMENLRAAMQDYIAMLAERGQQPPDDAKIKMLGESDLDKKLKAMEDAARSGKSAAAEEMLSEFEDLMKNLQIRQGKGGGDGAGGKNAAEQMQKQMDQLSDIMRRQQQLLDETHKRREQALNEGGGKNSPQDKGGQNPAERQGKLRQDLQNLQKQLESRGLAPKGGFGRAQQDMQAGEQALRQGDDLQAQQNQADSLQSLRQGAQDLMGKMRDAMAKQGAAQDKDSANGRGRDPLGRPAGQGQAEQGDALPQGEAAARARQILDEIRKKLGNLTPKQEKEYLERLLNLN